MKTKENKKRFNFWPYLKPYGLLIFVYLLLYVAIGGISIFNTVYSANALSAITEGQYRLAIQMTFTIMVLILIHYIINHLLEIIYNVLEMNIIRDMSVDVVNQAFKISSHAYSNHKTGNFIARISSDPDKIFYNLERITGQVTIIITNLIVLSYIAYLNIWVGVISIVAIILGSIIENIRKKKMKVLRKTTDKKHETVSSIVNEVVRSEKDIKSLGLENELKSNLISNYDIYRKHAIKSSRYGHRMWTLRIILVNILLSTSLILGIILLDKGLLTFAAFMLIYSNRGSMHGLSNSLGNIQSYYNDLTISVDRIRELFEDDEYQLEHFGSRHLENVKGKIEFKNVLFSYTDYKERDEKDIESDKKYNKKHKIKTRVPTREISGNTKVFDKLSFVIEPNSTVAFVGKSGSGKSTILNLVSKMYNADKGKVLLDGVDVQTLDKDTLRSSISLVNQFPYIFDMSIKENLLLAKADATDEEITEALKNSALDDFVDTLSNGVNTIVGESGINSLADRNNVSLSLAHC